MKYDPKIHKRRSIRIKGYDYSIPDGYFVTVCTHLKKCVLGTVKNNRVVLSDLGKLVDLEWKNLTVKYPNIELNEYIVMPNHIHAVLHIRRGGVSPPNAGGCGGNNDGHFAGNITSIENSFSQNIAAPRGGETPPVRKRPSLGNIMGYFKYQSTKKINQLYSQPGNKFWHRNYYEHIIRDEFDLDRICDYIRCNPNMWGRDRNNIDK